MIVIQFRECVLCKQDVGCLPGEPYPVCSTHTEAETRALAKIMLATEHPGWPMRWGLTEHPDGAKFLEAARQKLVADSD